MQSDMLRAQRSGANPMMQARPAEIHLRDRLAVFSRYRYVAVLAFIVVFAGAAFYAYSQTPLYRATARLLIELEDERSLTMEGLSTQNNSNSYQDPEPYFQTQYRILTGRELARHVVDALGGARLRDLGTSSEAQASALAGRVSVDPVRASRLVDVGFVSPDPKFAALAVNTLAETYVQQNLELRRQNMERSLEWLSQELARQKNLVETSERAMAQYREDQNALSLEDRQNIVIARLNQLNDAATRARTNRAQKESLYRRVESLASSGSPDSLPGILQNPYIQSLKTRLVELERRRAQISERYGEKHPEMLTVNAEIQDATRQLNLEIARQVEAIRHDYESARLEETTLATALEEQKDAATDLNRKSVNYTVMQREAESNRELYQTLLKREKELQVLANSRGNNVRLIEQAAVPGAPFSPNLRRAATLGGVVALLVAVGLVLVLDYLDDTIKTPEDVTRLGLPFLALIPAVRSSRGRPVLSGSNDFSEAIRSLRTSIALSAGTQGSNVLLVTSAQPLEGKTTTACNLATALAYGGQKVLLIDADMRRPGVHRGLGVDNECGLSELLSGRAGLSQCVQRLVEPDLWVMPAGSTPPNPSELLGSGRMETLMAQVQAGPFEWVIIDTPPVLAVTDASILTQWVSGVAFVVGSEMTRRRLAERAIETLTAGRPRILGAVLNRVNVSRNKYYYARHYGYGNKYLLEES
jgi:capsular exopolysaccharide synthesis family protein